jgi:hypothetical protein
MRFVRFQAAKKGAILLCLRLSAYFSGCMGCGSLKTVAREMQ